MTGPPRPVILAVFALLAVTFAIIQPLPHLPDEPAHLQYIDFLAAEHRLPIWEPSGGEAGFESQHPPLSYLFFVPARLALTAVSPAVRLQTLRFLAIAVGLLWLWLCDRLFAQLFGPDDPRRQYAVASVAWLPLVLLYSCHPNPDLFVALFATWALTLAVAQTENPSPGRAVWLGLAIAGALWSKLSGAATLVLPLAVWLARPGAGRAARARDLALSWTVAVAAFAPWIVRNLALYGHPITKTVAPYGSALDWVAMGRANAGELLGLTLRNTYLSTWSQPDWVPGWPLATPGGPDLPFFPVILFYGALTAFLLAAVVGLRRAAPAERSFLAIGAALLLALLAGHQLAFWTQDVEFNMGGRYVLSAMGFLAGAIVIGLGHLHRRLLPAWLGLLLLFDLVAIPTILWLLNPHYHPAWRAFNLP